MTEGQSEIFGCDPKMPVEKPEGTVQASALILFYGKDLAWT